MAVDDSEKPRDDDKPKESEESVNFDDMWNTIYVFDDMMKPIMGSEEDTDQVCPMSDLSSCRAGRILVPCKDKPGKFRCQKCDRNSFRNSKAFRGDTCRRRKNCEKPFMNYADMGSETRDAVCECHPGYHFQNEDQRACVQNRECPKGYTHGLYGNCESCLEKSMYSTSSGTTQKCQPLTNCEKKMRCTTKRSDGTQNNICGPVVSDLKTCKEVEYPSSSATSTTSIAIACGVAGAILLVIFILILLVLLRRRRRRRMLHRQNRRSLSAAQQEELRHHLLKEVERNAAFRNKAFSTSFSFIEERIDKQMWDLARELFRSHQERDKYEKIVKKYKDTPSQAKRFIREYLQEWKQWRGESKWSLEELFRCLHQVKRENIANEICLCLSNDIDSHLGEEYRSSLHEESLAEECCAVLIPCREPRKDKKSWKEPSFVSSQEVKPPPDQADTKLLGFASDDLEDYNDSNGGGGGGCRDPTIIKPPGMFCSPSDRPSPSAPPACDEPPTVEYHNPKTYKCQFSQPVQATS